MDGLDEEIAETTATHSAIAEVTPPKSSDPGTASPRLARSWRCASGLRKATEWSSIMADGLGTDYSAQAGRKRIASRCQR